MVPGWRAVTEAVRQKVVTSDKDKFTSNARNEAMFKEATDFAQHLKLLDKDLRALQKQAETNFSNLKFVLSSPLPRVYEETSNGIIAIEDDTKMIGHGVNIDSISSSSEELKKRLDEEVLLPLRQWVAAYQAIKDRMYKLEQVRLEVDSRKRTVEQLKDKVDKARQAVAASAAKNRAKAEAELDKAIALLQHKDDKLNRTSASYQELERTVYNSLYTLIKDTSVLREYAAVSIKIVQDSYLSAYRAFSLSTLPPEYQSTTTGGLGLNTGIFGAEGAATVAGNTQFENSGKHNSGYTASGYSGMNDTDASPDVGVPPPTGYTANHTGTGAGMYRPCNTGTSGLNGTDGSSGRMEPTGSTPQKGYSNSGASSAGAHQNPNAGNDDAVYGAPGMRDDDYDVPDPVHRRNNSGSMPRAASPLPPSTNARYGREESDLGSPIKHHTGNMGAAGNATGGSAAAGGPGQTVKLFRNNSELNGTGGRYQRSGGYGAPPSPVNAGYGAAQPQAAYGGNYGGNYGDAYGAAGGYGGQDNIRRESPIRNNPYAAAYQGTPTKGY